MFVQIYDSPYFEALFDDELKLSEVNWKAESVNLTDEIYKKEMLEIIELGFKYRYNKTISDIRNMFFGISPDLQKWADKEIMPKMYEIGIRKIAVIMSADLIMQLSIEQLMEEPEALKITTNFFDSRDKALDWILK